MSAQEQVVDAEVVDEPGTELVPQPQQAAATLFRTDDPVEVITRATAAADALKQVLVSRSMVQMIQRKEYVKVEGWQTLGAMLGINPVVVWTRPTDGGWEARVEARSMDGRVVGAAEAMCVESEGGNWGPRATSNARRSMAQTRATSKALRGPLGFVVTLAGYQATPAEEMTHVAEQERQQHTAPAAAPSEAVGREQADRLIAAVQTGIDAGSVTVERVATMLTAVGASSARVTHATIRALTPGQADELEQQLTAVAA